MIKALHIAHKIAANNDSQVYHQYSGRGMYGRNCIGITTSNMSKIIEEGAIHGLRGAVTDNMGRQYIVYWPNIDADAGIEPNEHNEDSADYFKDEDETE